MKNNLLFVMSFLFFTLQGQDCELGTASAPLNTNNISTNVFNSGDFWWDRRYGKYEFPKGSGKHLIYTGGLNLFALDAEGNLRVAFVTYLSSQGSDFFPGPYYPEGEREASNCSDWNRIWSVDKQVVDLHLLDYQSDGVIDNPNEQILAWPGRNNASFLTQNGFDLLQDRDFAPFVDLDGDGNYEPMDGEYPAIKGEQNHWWLLNDVGGSPPFRLEKPIEIEVGIMAYASSSAEASIDNSTFYDFTFRYMGAVPLVQFNFGLFVDFDLGCPFDDYIGFDIESNLAYAYNEDVIDGINGDDCYINSNEDYATYTSQVPMVGITLIDDQPYQVGLTQGLAFNRRTNQPNITWESLMACTWGDGTPFTYGGNGYNPTSIDSVCVLYPDDPADSTGWSMCTTVPPSDDRRALMISSVREQIETSELITATYAVVAIEDVELPCPSLGPLRDAVDVVSAYQGSVNVSEKKIEGEALTLYPNPSEDRITIRAPRRISKVTVLDMMGKTAVTVDNVDSSEHTLSIQDLSQGVYYIEASLDNQESLSQKFIKI